MKSGLVADARQLGRHLELPMARMVIRVPATTANLGPGFDCLGLALNLCNEVSLAAVSDGLSITIDGEGSGSLPTHSGNLVARAANLVFELVGQRPKGLSIHQRNQIPVGSGLGSSAAAAVSGLLGANALVDAQLPVETLLRLAVTLEGHPDNVAAALFGGLVLVYENRDEIHVSRFEVPPMRLIVALPDFTLPTKKARSVLPKSVPLADAIFNIGRTSLLLEALRNADFDALRIAVQDKLHQPFRLPLIPGMSAAFSAAMDAGAAAVALSGAGPSLVAFAAEGHERIAQAVSAAFADVGLACRTWFLAPAGQGAKILPQDAVV